ncbi:YvrJ family protein [Pisciglobus halotolerans]|uniref:YvrJ protein family protein n=1 Tax=Pisciglobus halotolerans TaxID=745365 RepID=A0A1I3B152_9LACT|nr:YvrJ family protein [Pisciglobus halotolerans]SFH56014.1 YvrJ protein family protein [Pisciglobus halotolerans]
MDPSTEWLSATVELVSNIGFPIFISLYLLQRMETKLDAVVKALQELSTVIKTAK